MTAIDRRPAVRAHIAALRPRRVELGLIALIAVVVVSAYGLASLGESASVPADIGPFLAWMLGLFFAAHLAVRRFAPAADPVLLPMALLLNGIGYVMIARLGGDVEDGGDLAGLQSVWTAVGIGAFVATLVFVRRVRMLAQYRYLLGVGGIGLLALPLLPIGIELNGARIWVSIGPVNFQPGEFAKLALAIFFAAYLADRRELIAASTWKVGPLRLPEPQHILPLVVAWGFAVLVMVGQRDLGSSLLFFTLFVVMLWVGTERNVYLILGIVLFSGAAYVAWRLFDHVQTRVSIWLDPWEDEYGSGFQIVQALYGIGDGGITGTGLGRGSPDKVPLAQNDFIFAAITEEMGLVGATSILMAYLLLIGAGFRIAIRTDRTFEKLLATGLTTIVGIQAFIIIGGVIKLVPLTGITLPFVSYGGSSLLANYILLALLIRLSDAGAIRRGERNDDPTPRERWAAWKLRRAERRLAP